MAVCNSSNSTGSTGAVAGDWCCQFGGPHVACWCWMLNSDFPNFETHTNCAAMVTSESMQFSLNCKCQDWSVACLRECALAASDYHGSSCSKTWASSSSDTPSASPCPISTAEAVFLVWQCSSASWRPCWGLASRVESLPIASKFASVSSDCLLRFPTPARTAYYTPATFLACHTEPHPDNTCYFPW